MLLLSQDYGKHLLGVEDLLQKHALVEADISIQADRVKAVSSNATRFSVSDAGEQTWNSTGFTLQHGAVSVLSFRLEKNIMQSYFL